MHYKTIDQETYYDLTYLWNGFYLSVCYHLSLMKFAKHLQENFYCSIKTILGFIYALWNLFIKGSYK